MSLVGYWLRRSPGTSSFRTVYVQCPIYQGFAPGDAAIPVYHIQCGITQHKHNARRKKAPQSSGNRRIGTWSFSSYGLSSETFFFSLCSLFPVQVVYPKKKGGGCAMDDSVTLLAKEPGFERGEREWHGKRLAGGGSRLWPRRRCHLPDGRFDDTNELPT